MFQRTGNNFLVFPGDEIPHGELPRLVQQLLGLPVVQGPVLRLVFSREEVSPFEFMVVFADYLALLAL